MYTCFMFSHTRRNGLAKAVQKTRKIEKETCPKELIAHISPIRLAHIRFYSDCMFSNKY